MVRKQEKRSPRRPESPEVVVATGFSRVLAPAGAGAAIALPAPAASALELSRIRFAQRWLSQLCWPGCCVLCQCAGEHGADLCRWCREGLPTLVISDPAVMTSSGTGVVRLCTRCGDAFSSAAQGAAAGTADGSVSAVSSAPAGPSMCPVCAARRPLYRRIVAPLRYDFPVDRLLHDLKYHHRRVVARVLGGLLAGAVGSYAARLPDLIIPVPLHQERWRARGYNHAADLAHWCAHALGRRASPRLATRIVDTGSLAGLSRAARQQRIRGAFEVHGSVADRRIAVVDDVLTTGATSGELTRELYDTGAASVELWVVARTASVR